MASSTAPTSCRTPEARCEGPGLVVRADGRPGVGLGHVARSAALAEAWTAAGGRALLLVDRTDDDVLTVVATAVANGVELVPTGPTPDDVRAAADSTRAAWVALDGYGYDVSFQRAAGRGRRVLVIDDHASHGAYAADLVLDQNAGARPDGYGDLDVLLGNDFVLLRGSLRGRRSDPAPEARVAVTFGGSGGEAAAAITAELAASGLDVAVDVLGPDLGVRGERCVAHGMIADPGRVYAAATLAVSAAGSTTWELCHLGVPAVLLTLADNQRAVAAAAADAGAAVDLGPIDRVRPAEVVAAVERLLHDGGARARMAEAGRTLVDGHGAARAVRAMYRALVDVRPVDERDAELLFDWVNDAAVRRASFATAPVAWQDHVAWLARTGPDPRVQHFVAEIDGRAVGQIRFDLDEEGRAASIDVSVAPEQRGRGLAPMVIDEGRSRLMAATDVAVLRAEVKADNIASARSFEAAGFQPVGTEHRSIGPVLVMEWAR